MMMPMRGLVARMRRHTSNPSMPGSITSSRATSVSGFSWSLSRASSPVSASTTSYPARRRLITIKLRMLDSSSRTITFLMDSTFLSSDFHAAHSATTRLKPRRRPSSSRPQ